MKIVWSMFVLISLLHSSTEIEIVEEAVDNITKLKNDYKICQEDLKNRFVKTDYKELEKYKILLKKEKAKNVKMLKDMEWFTQTIEKLENDLNKNKKELADIKAYKNIKTSKLKQIAAKSIIQHIVLTKPATFHLISDANIYKKLHNKINGVKIYRWTKNRTFTSNIRSENWIKITGYFVGRKWKKAKNSIWIQASKVVKR